MNRAMTSRKAILLAAAMLSPAGEAASVPVDLRPVPGVPGIPAAAAPRPQAVPGDVHDDGAHLMASRMVLNDLLGIAEVLSLETRDLDLDSSELWNQWRSVVPLDPWSSAQERGGVEALRQSEVFGIHGQGMRLAARGAGQMDRIRKAENEWWRLWKILDAAAKTGRSAEGWSRGLTRLKSRLEAIARESDALDGALRLAQGQYDLVRPLALDHLSGSRAASVVLAPARHWISAAAGRPRPDLRYDFEARYEAHYEESLSWLRARAQKR